ncbi:MAG: hypothetical protein ACE5KM_04245 [Planctomycetaceae bacterium]
MRTLSLFAFLAVAVNASPTWSCSCIAPPPPKTALAKSAAVFLAKVVDIERGKRQYEVTFEISRTWKGTRGKNVTVHTALSGAACGYGFKKGKSYLVYCYQAKKDGKPIGPMRTNICTRTKPLERAKADLKELGEGKKP